MTDILIERWPALILSALFIIGAPYALFSLFLSSLKRHPAVPKEEYFSNTPKIVVVLAWVMLSVSLLDIFVLQTLVITYGAAFFSAVVTTAVTGYISWVAKFKYNLVARINNG